MAMPRIVPPIEYLREASQSSLQSFELSRLNHAANLRREISTLIDQWIRENSEALLARWVLDHRASAIESAKPTATLDPAQRAALLESPRTPRDPFQTLLPSDPVSSANSQPQAAQNVAAPPRFADSRRPLQRHPDRKPQKQKSVA